MPIYNPLFFIPFTAGLIFFIAGVILLKYPPKKINGFYGYRTSNSMKNQERWDFAQTYSGRELAKLGGLLALSGLIGLFYAPGFLTSMIVGMGLMFLMIIILITRVERAINQKFK